MTNDTNKIFIPPLICLLLNYVRIYYIFFSKIAKLVGCIRKFEKYWFFIGVQVVFENLNGQSTNKNRVFFKVRKLLSKWTIVIYNLYNCFFSDTNDLKPEVAGENNTGNENSKELELSNNIVDKESQDKVKTSFL